MAEQRELTLRIGQILVGDPAQGQEIRLYRQGQKVADPGDLVERFGVEAFEETWAEWLEEHPEDAPPKPVSFDQAVAGGDDPSSGAASGPEGNAILAMDEDEVKKFVKEETITAIVAAVADNPKAASIVLEMEEETSGGDVRKGLVTQLGHLADQYEAEDDVNAPPEDEEA